MGRLLCLFLGHRLVPTGRVCCITREHQCSRCGGFFTTYGWMPGKVFRRDKEDEGEFGLTPTHKP